MIGLTVVPASGRAPAIHRPTSGATGLAVFRGGTTFAGAAQRAAAPKTPGLSLERIRVFEEEEGEGHELPLPAGAAPAVGGPRCPDSRPACSRSSGGLDAFDDAATTGFDFEPPDQGLCVGNGFVLESINVTIRPFDDTGSALAPPTEMNRFYGSPPLFDPATDRFGPVLTESLLPLRPPDEALLPDRVDARGRSGEWRSPRAAGRTQARPAVPRPDALTRTRRA